MSNGAKDMMRKLALKIHNDPTANSEAKKLARGMLLLLDGRLP